MDKRNIRWAVLYEIKNKNNFKLYLIEISMIEGIIYFLFNEI